MGKSSVAGVSEENRDNIYYYGGRARISGNRFYSPFSAVCMKFSEYYLALTSGENNICEPSPDDEGEGLGFEGCWKDG